MSLVDQAYQNIKDRILRNEYGPRYQALEQEIADDLGMSRTPVREALIRLENEGLVECIPRRGMRVVPLSSKDMREIYQVLTCLETMAVDLLARKHPKPKDITPLQNSLEKMDQALETKDLSGWAKADEQFHKSLLDLCGNRRLADMANTVFDQVYRARASAAIVYVLRNGNIQIARATFGKKQKTHGQQPVGFAFGGVCPTTRYWPFCRASAIACCRSRIVW